jgi:hypothetical protein
MIAATRLTCQATAIDLDDTLSLELRREQLLALWRARPSEFTIPKELVPAYADVATRLHWFAIHSDEWAEATVESEGLALARRWTAQDPLSADAWRLLTNLHYYRVFLVTDPANRAASTPWR